MQQVSIKETFTILALLTDRLTLLCAGTANIVVFTAPLLKIGANSYLLLRLRLCRLQAFCTHIPLFMDIIYCPKYDPAVLSRPCGLGSILQSVQSCRISDFLICYSNSGQHEASYTRHRTQGIVYKGPQKHLYGKMDCVVATKLAVGYPLHATDCTALISHHQVLIHIKHPTRRANNLVKCTIHTLGLGTLSGITTGTCPLMASASPAPLTRPLFFPAWPPDISPSCCFDLAPLGGAEGTTGSSWLSKPYLSWAGLR